MCLQTRTLSAALRRRAQRALCWHCKEAEPRGTTQQRRAKVGSKRRATHPGHVPADTHVVRSTQETRTACPVLALQRSRVPRSDAAPPSQGRLKAVCSGLEHGDFLRLRACRHACCPRCPREAHSAPCLSSKEKRRPKERRSAAEPGSAQSNAPRPCARQPPAAACLQTCVLSAAPKRGAQRAVPELETEAQTQGATQRRRARVGSKQRAPALCPPTSRGCMPADVRMAHGLQERCAACPVWQRS